MPFYVYILYSEVLNQYYTGSTANLEDRLFRHNNSGSKATKKAHDWKIAYREVFESRQDAVRRELQIKSKKSRQFIEALININQTLNE